MAAIVRLQIPLHCLHVYLLTLALRDYRIEEFPHVRVMRWELVDLLTDAVDRVFEIGVIVSAEGIV